MAAGLVLAVQPAHADDPSNRSQPRPPAAQAPAPGEPSIAEVRQMLGEMGAWSLEYSGILGEAGRLMDQVEGYTAILDAVGAGSIRKRQAIEQMESWRRTSIARAQAVRERAVALRPPPSLAAMGPDGVDLEAALVLARNDLPLVLDEIITSLDAFAAYGLDAINNRERAVGARLRAIYTSHLQLISIDSRRIRAASRAVATDHPNRFVMEATIEYYRGLAAFGEYGIRALEAPETDTMIVAQTLRDAAVQMRTKLARTETEAQRTLREQRDMRYPPGAETLQRTIIEMTETYPETVRLYRELADTLDTAAAAIEAGGVVSEAWSAQEDIAIPLLERIALVEEQRAQIGAELRR
ncbi:hypothetical protein ATE48_06245 [Candidatus Viadribacter manganicus]|uniref:Uncharacterized protein n=1 Tax=Candidatus Viadribacter manganicus TaxID=1759059 RepID=A0A1B1AG80_9PROT|nr:hypothetical protein ATE48_06245 [Candidatus Viadribacter manganicus]